MKVPPLPTSVYIVAWTGGYEAPSYTAFFDEARAWDQAYEWVEEMEEGVDTIDVLRLDLPSLKMERLEASSEKEKE